jgi:hypothetical protein
VAYKIFVSHVWRVHDQYYWGLIRLLDQTKRFDFVDLSVPKLRPFEGDYATVREDIMRLVRAADVVLTINTPVITNSEAVQDELTEAERLHIPIVAVRPPKRSGKKMLFEKPFGRSQRHPRIQLLQRRLLSPSMQLMLRRLMISLSRSEVTTRRNTSMCHPAGRSTR